MIWLFERRARRLDRKQGFALSPVRKQGFALPAVLTVITILTLIFLTVILSLRDLYKEAGAAGDEAEFERAAMTAEARFAWLAATEPLSNTGLMVGAARNAPGADLMSAGGPTVYKATRDSISEVRLDGRPYLFREGGQGPQYRIAVQDEAGLVNLDYAPPAALQRFFETAGADNGLATRLTDQLLDYIDPDDLRRASGAEAADYAAAGRSPPANRPFGRLGELPGLLDWPRFAPRWKAAADLATVQSDDLTFNLNTAPPQALQIYFGLGETAARAAVTQRETTPLLDPAMVGATPQEGVSYIFPNGRFRFKFSDPVRGFVYQSEVLATPTHIDRPIWTQFPLTTRQKPDANARPTSELAAFPGFDAPSKP